MKIPIKITEDILLPNIEPCGFVDISQEIVDKYANNLLEINMAFEKKWNKSSGDWDIIPHSFSFNPKTIYNG